MSLFNLKIYPLDQEFVGKIDIESNAGENQAASINTIIILDSSGSMGKDAGRLVNEVFPLFLKKLSYGPSQTIHLITFDSASCSYKSTVDGLKSLKINSGGYTYMRPAVTKCKELLNSLYQDNVEKRKPIRLLTISDGAIHDAQQTAEFTQQLYDFVIGKFRFSSQAVRFVNSSSQPDTTAIASLLRLNETSGITTKLVDIPASESSESVATKIAELFVSDNISSGSEEKVLKAKSPIILRQPWEETSTSEITLKAGKNLIWFNRYTASEALNINENPVQVNMEDPLDLPHFQDMMEDEMDFVADHVKVLKVVGTDEANKKVAKIVNYFEIKEDALAEKSTFKKKNLTHALKKIADDGRVNDLDQNERANYLREAVEVPKEKILLDVAIQTELEQADAECMASFEEPPTPKLEQASQTADLILTEKPRPSWISDLLGVNIDDFDRKERLMFVLLMMALIHLLVK